MPYIVGIDFDNTIVSYDVLMHGIALDLGYINNDTAKDKTVIREKIRNLPEGENKWRKVQAIAYGESMGQATLIEGVKSFFKTCADKGITTYIISHKGEYAAADEKNINLRDAALNWMNKNKFFDSDGLGLNRANVFFETTRQEKVERIGKVGCSYFIDDLEETFLEAAFPNDVKKVLFAPHKKEHDLNNVTVFDNWSKIHEHILN